MKITFPFRVGGYPLSAPELTITSPFRHGEAARLYDLLSLKVMNTPREPIYDAVVDLAATMFSTPMAFVSFLDAEKQWVKAAHGRDEAYETSHEVSFCAYTISEPETMIVGDTLLDPRFRNHPLVEGPPHIRFYAGAQLITANRQCVGTVCIADVTPRFFEPERYRQLEKLARVVVEALETRR